MAVTFWSLIFARVSDKVNGLPSMTVTLGSLRVKVMPSALVPLEKSSAVDTTSPKAEIFLLMTFPPIAATAAHIRPVGSQASGAPGCECNV
jgi:hypothetical protein